MSILKDLNSRELKYSYSNFILSKKWVVRMTKPEYKPLETPFKSVNEALKATVDKYPDNIAIDYTARGVKLTYKEFYENILKFANALKAKGIGKGDTVGIVLSNCPEFAISFMESRRVIPVSLVLASFFRKSGNCFSRLFFL